jgi:hypothetical protein
LQHAEAEAEVLAERFEPRQRLPLAVSLPGLLDAAELDQGLSACFCRRHACAEILIDVHLKVAFQFGSEFSIGVRSSDSPEPHPQRS